MKDEEKEISWDEFDRDNTKSADYWKPEFNEGYQVVFKSAQPIMKAFRNEEPKPKVLCEIATVNGKQPEQKYFETGSWTIIQVLKKHATEKTLNNTTFLLKKRKEGDNTKYTFDEIPQVAGNQPASSSDPVA